MAALLVSVLPLSAEQAESRLAIPIAVRDSHGNQPNDLTMENFKCRIAGQPVRVASTALESRPLRVAIIVDTSRGMKEDATTAWRAAEDLVASLTPANRAMILTLTNRLDAHSDLSTEPKELAEALAKAKATGFGGPVALWDAVKDASHEFSRRWDVGDAIAIVTHGLDTGSARKGVKTSDDLYVFGLATRAEEDSVHEATKAVAFEGTRLFMLRVSVKGSYPDRFGFGRPWLERAEYWVRGVTAATGGEVVSADDGSAVRSLGQSLAQFYQVELAATNSIEQPEACEVEVVGRDGKRLKVVYPHVIAPQLRRHGGGGEPPSGGVRR